MAYFEYSGRDSKGTLVNGHMDASTADDVAATLVGDSITPINIKRIERRQTIQQSRYSNGQHNPTATDRINALLGANKIEIDELITFARQMYSLTKSGLPLDKCIRGLEASMSNLAFRRVLQDLLHALESGTDLAGAMGRHPKVFSTLFLSLIHVGENTGRLDLAFQEIGKYLELEKQTTKKVKSATRYPIFVLVAMAAALAVITVWVIPVFRDAFESFGAELPWQTRALMNTSDFVINYWPLILVTIFGCVFGFMSWVRTERGRLRWDQRKLKLPLAGDVLERIALARFARTASMVLAAGLPIVQGLNVVATAVGNAYIAKYIEGMREGVERGETLYSTAVRSGMFSPLVLQMIAVGEESGTVDQLLQEVAEFYETEVEYDINRLSDSIEPILIVFIAGLVLVLALGVFLPIWDLNTTINT